VQKAIGTRNQAILQELLLQCRLDAGLTQRDLALRLNTVHSRIGGYETGQRRMDLVQLNEYTAALGVPLDDFVGRFLRAVRASEDAPDEP
jgi:transcriptional regulator with XRE-family HTH domain